MGSLTGELGTGKSTLVDHDKDCVKRANGRPSSLVGDPSSSYSHGAIRRRSHPNAEHHDDPGVFIRSMANRGKAGGLARASLEVALLSMRGARLLFLLEGPGAFVRTKSTGAPRPRRYHRRRGVRASATDVQAIKSRLSWKSRRCRNHKSDKARGRGRMNRRLGHAKAWRR